MDMPVICDQYEMLTLWFKEKYSEELVWKSIEGIELWRDGDSWSLIFPDRNNEGKYCLALSGGLNKLGDELKGIAL